MFDLSGIPDDLKRVPSATLRSQTSCRAILFTKTLCSVQEDICAMIQSLFILNSSGEVIIEKHWRGNVHRNESIAFWRELVRRGGASSVRPHLPTKRGALIHLQRAGLYFLACATLDAVPLSVSAFLGALADVLTDYLGELGEHAIKDHFITVYELLDEMLDNGHPLTMEPNVLKEIIPPPSMLSRVMDTLTGEPGPPKLAQANSAHALLPWRRANVRYAQNEVFVDVIETMDATFSPTGALVRALVHGELRLNTRLSGTPELTFALNSSAPLDDVAAHHAVRGHSPSLARGVSLVPPDGPCTLLRYIVRDSRALTPPMAAQARIEIDPVRRVASVSVVLQPRWPDTGPSSSSRVGTAGSLMLAQVMGGKVVGASHPDVTASNVGATIPFGAGLFRSASLSANCGTVAFDPITGICDWKVGTLARGKVPNLIGNVTLEDGVSIPRPPLVALKFRIPGIAPSGMVVERLDLKGESYKYYKGLRCVTKAGHYEIRT